MSTEKIRKREKRQKRVRGKIFGSQKKPRLSVFRSNKYTYAQIIDDTKGNTLVAVKDAEILGDRKGTRGKTVKKESKDVKTKKEIAVLVGELLAKKALKKKIKKVIFDRGGYKYHGRVKALAEGARKGGLEF